MNQWRQECGRSTSYRKCSLTGTIWSLENIKFFYADDLNSLKRGGGRHAGWIILWWGCGAEVDIREYSGWPLKR